MTFDCSLTVSGLDPQTSAKAFIDSYNQTSQLSHYQKFHNKLEQYFVNKIDRNIARNNIKSDKIKGSFSVNFKGKNLEFTSNYPGAKRLEFGSGNKPPLRFIQPAVIETANELSEIIISEAITAYNNNSRFGVGMRTIQAPQSNYFNKYSRMLK